ncbi:MAG: hypothetical protein HYT73_04845 [Candidatus Aenigmarchaeota archaeon]|nr:hypothetical protein [Candidatus Aenigmarchaeota archaeon]
MRRFLAFIVVIAVAAFAVLYLYGSSIDDSCVTIGGEKTCWKGYTVTVSSEFCTRSPCQASPELQRHNAVVDAIVAGCDRTKSQDFSDTRLNSDIEDALKLITSYDVNVRTLCSDPGIILAKKFYD